MGLFRIFPVALNILACVAFLVVLERVFGRWRALGVYLACLLTPMFTAFSQGLHFQGYAHSLLLIEIALVMDVMSRSRHAGPVTMTALLLIGFIQGWLSWDHCFLVSFAPVPLTLLVTPAECPIPWRNVLAQCVAVGVGFTAAHALHFIQVALYFGGLRAGLEHFAMRATKKYEADELMQGLSWPGRLKFALEGYIRAYIGPNHFARAGRLVVYATVAILALRRAEFKLGRWRMDLQVTRPSPRDLAAIAAALVIGLAWIMKTSHAANHLYFITRHLFPFYLTCCLVIARSIEVYFSRGPVNEDQRNVIPVHLGRESVGHIG